VEWDSDQGLDAAAAANGERLLLGRPVVMDDSSPNYLEPVEGRFLLVPPTKHLLTILKAFGLKFGFKLCVCKPRGLGASLNRLSKRKFRLGLHGSSP
jgi:hypothetical protein